jgi:hypothetical protein
MLQAGWPRVRDPIKSLNISSQPHYTLEITQSLSEKSTRTSFWDAERCRSVRPTALPPSVSRLSRQYETLSISYPYRPSRPVIGIVLLFFFCIVFIECNASFIVFVALCAVICLIVVCIFVCCVLL